ncbi:MAG TPA: C1 family peptidase, partial [Chitinophagaceae bacterium]|nr:C1 family peptidase [Chitinophagaceae bacterium]
SSVSINIDNTVVSTSNSYSLNTANYAAGYHTIKATALDAAGNQGSSSITVLVNVTVVPPPPAINGVSLVMPTPGNQGGEGCCIAFSVGYAARSAEQYYRTNAGSYSNSTNIFSPEFLYNQVKFGSDCGSGTSMQTALDFIVANGICSYQSMPYSGTNGCSLLPTTTQLSEALNYKISTYSKISILDRTAIKAMISQHHPVIITILADNSFVNATTGFVWKTFSGSGNLPHSVAICGYDDSKNAYKIMNSWGTTWGDSGFSWIDYDFFETGGHTAGNGYCYVIN